MVASVKIVRVEMVRVKIVRVEMVRTEIMRVKIVRIKITRVKITRVKIVRVKTTCKRFSLPGPSPLRSPAAGLLDFLRSSSYSKVNLLSSSFS